MKRSKNCYNPCDDCQYGISKHNQEHKMCKICEFRMYRDLEEQKLLLKLPCKVGSTVYVITTCKDFVKVLDGTLWGDGGGFGTATGYYCPYELRDSCPHEDDFEECEGGCECFENKLAVFEDFVESIMIYENEYVVFLGDCGSVSFEAFGKTVFITKEEAEKKLAEMEKKHEIN